MRHRNKAGAWGLITLALAGVAAACMHPPVTYKGSWEETAQQALIFHRGDREELVLKVSYKFSPKGDLPASFGWVIPVPAKPDAYDVVDSKVFENVHDLSEMYREPLRVNGQLAKSAAPEAAPAAVAVIDHQVVGEFDITALGAEGDKAPAELNKWLSKNGYKEIPPANLKYFTNLGWTFLAVKVDPSKGSQEVAKSGDLNSLRISFECEDIVYPLKLSAGEGSFDVVTYVLTEKPLETPRWLDRYGFVITTYNIETQQRGSVKVENLSLPRGEETPLAQLKAKIEKGKAGKFESLYLTTFKAADVNSKENPIAEWKTDFVVREARDEKK